MIQREKLTELDFRSVATYIDGAMGTMIQREKLSEPDFRSLLATYINGAMGTMRQRKSSRNRLKVIRNNFLVFRTYNTPRDKPEALREPPFFWWAGAAKMTIFKLLLSLKCFEHGQDLVNIMIKCQFLNKI